MASHAQSYIEALAWGGPVTWQTFDDGPEKNPRLARVMHGTLAEHGQELVRLNRAGAGVFVTVNETDGNGRRASNVVGLRALFTDDDGGGLTRWPVEPSFFVQSASGTHTYWLLRRGEPVSRFREAQSELARWLNTDPKVCDLPRVMRCPGFMHCKREPVRVTFHVNRLGVVYSIDDVIGPIPKAQVSARAPRPRAQQPQQGGQRSREWWSSLRNPIAEGNRNGELFRIACAMRRDGLGEGQILDAIAEVNQRLCSAPLEQQELAVIARSAARY